MLQKKGTYLFYELWRMLCTLLNIMLFNLCFKGHILFWFLPFLYCVLWHCKRSTTWKSQRELPSPTENTTPPLPGQAFTCVTFCMCISVTVTGILIITFIHSSQSADIQLLLLQLLFWITLPFSALPTLLCFWLATSLSNAHVQLTPKIEQRWDVSF